MNCRPPRRVTCSLFFASITAFSVGTFAMLPFALAAEPVGDGVADDTAAIQQWIDAERDVQLPVGTYRITRPLRVDLKSTGAIAFQGEGRSRIVMAGPGPAIQVMGTHAGTADPSTVTDDIWNQQNAVIISDLEIVGEHPQADGVELSGTMQPTLHNLTIRKSRHAIHLVDRNRNVIVSDCHLYENSGVGLFLDAVNLHQINVTGSHISYNAGGGIASHDGNVRNLHITGCDIEGNMGSADAASSANVWLTSGSGSIGEVAITGCTIQHTHQGKDSANIRIDLHSQQVNGTEERRHGNITISGNILSDTQVNVHLRHLRSATVTGNTIWKGFQSNVVLENCEAVTLASNAMDRNPRYHLGRNTVAKHGVQLTDCRDCVLSANVIRGVNDRPAVLELTRCQGILVQGGVFSDDSLPAILAVECADCVIRNNIVRGGDSPIQLRDCEGMQTD
ncbi:right-handed parallel beta-helix repeat-containing protein [Rhodopirellula sp. P2]|uniref:right-handed parallel beta-helix repeat-containing protein n=1 Tax=Rhodopirellula sp. P2 TaxID=2127060 RepID=UPI002368AC6D|nr:right-handed parallel beta-helix repeat-containing protein [Rhodopirellula sp. P2]WDQ14772.1 right-handed parallel beta-helix repeat-containing protein [Rhodopirellula sp. P2]